MRDIYYHRGNAHPQAIVAEQREDGHWVMENEGRAITTTLPTDRFFVGFMEATKEITWSSQNQKSILATDIRTAIRKGAQLTWLRTKEEARSHNEGHPDSLYLNLNGLHAYRFEDFPRFWSALAGSNKPLMHEDHEDWALPLVALNHS